MNRTSEAGYGIPVPPLALWILADTAAASAYLQSRRRGAWDPALSADAVFDWYNARVGGYAPVTKPPPVHDTRDDHR